MVGELDAFRDVHSIVFFSRTGLKAGGGGGGSGGPGVAGQQFFYPNVDPHQTFRMFFVRETDDSG